LNVLADGTAVTGTDGIADLPQQERGWLGRWATYAGGFAEYAGSES
jgi:hypothetical protein